MHPAALIAVGVVLLLFVVGGLIFVFEAWTAMMQDDPNRKR